MFQGQNLFYFFYFHEKASSGACPQNNSQPLPPPGEFTTVTSSTIPSHPPPIMEGIDGVSMNIINDDFTPVRATAAAQGVNVARASVQHPDSNHWPTDLNRVVAHDYQLFTAESFAKKRRFETFHVQTFGENILLSIPPDTSVPDLLGKLKASYGKLKEMAGKYISLEEKLKATKRQAFISVSNAKKNLSENTGQYHRILERWQK